MPWFWEGELQGGGVLNDMMCHSVEEARFMLTEPGKPRDSIKPISVSAHTDCLKWQRPKYADILSKNSGGKTNYLDRPSEDFARSLIEYLDEDGEKLIVETTTSWCFVGEGLRLSMELFGPEYSMFVNTLDPDLRVFFSREVVGGSGEDLVEKQNAESGGMPVVSSEAEVYGYTAENRHMVESFLAGKRPEENFDDGLNVTELLMTAYMSAEQGKTVSFPPIINAAITTVTTKTKNLFVEVTGINKDDAEDMLSVVATILQSAGFTLEHIQISGAKNSSPKLQDKKMKVDSSLINQTLGLNLNTSKIITSLKKSRLNAISKGKNIEPNKFPLSEIHFLPWVPLPLV